VFWPFDQLFGPLFAPGSYSYVALRAWAAPLAADTPIVVTYQNYYSVQVTPSNAGVQNVPSYRPDGVQNTGFPFAYQASKEWLSSGQVVGKQRSNVELDLLLPPGSPAQIAAGSRPAFGPILVFKRRYDRPLCLTGVLNSAFGRWLTGAWQAIATTCEFDGAAAASSSRPTPPTAVGPGPCEKPGLQWEVRPPAV
jgi:hypothetical protein